MTLTEMEPALIAEANHPKNRSLFMTAQAQNAGLNACESPAELLSTLEDTSLDRYPEREVLIRATIAAYQARPHSFWNSLLILAFLPMLRNLVRRTISGPSAEGELEQVVLARFLGVVASFDLTRHTDKTFVRIRSATEDAVFGELSAEQFDMEQSERRAPEEVDKLVEVRGTEGQGGWPSYSQPRRKRRTVDVDARSAFLEEHAAPHLNPDHFELVMATLGRGESIADYVREQHPDLGEDDRRRLYQRLKRCHTRAVQRLRGVLGPRRGAIAEEHSDVLPN